MHYILEVQLQLNIDINFNPLPAIGSNRCTASIRKISQRVHKVAKIDACIVKHNFSPVFWHSLPPKRVRGILRGRGSKGHISFRLVPTPKTSFWRVAKGARLNSERIIIIAPCLIHINLCHSQHSTYV